MPSTPEKATPLYEGESVFHLDAPNHLVSLQLDEPVKGRKRSWPLVGLLEDTSARPRELFVHPSHGNCDQVHRSDYPPTWMDPELLVRQALEDPAIQHILRVAYSKNDGDAWRRLRNPLIRIFDEVYLPELISRFERDAVALLAKWLLRHYADQQITESIARPPKRRRRPE